MTFAPARTESASTRRRPLGLAPRETSARVNAAVLAEHVGDAAAGWRRRAHLVDAPHVRLHHLARADERLFAHLAGIRIAGEAGWQAVRAAQADGDAGVVSVFAWMAFVEGEVARMREALPVLLADPAFTDAGAGALASLAPARLHESLQRLAESPLAAHRRLALAVHALQRRDPGALLVRSLSDNDPALRARALRAVGELGRNDLVAHAVAALRDTDPACRAAAAGSVFVLGDPGDVASARATVLADAPAWPAARRRSLLERAIRASEPSTAREHVRQLAAGETTLRDAVIAAGAHGDPIVVPWLIERMSDPALARVAAEAVALIAGADLELATLKSAGAVEDVPGTAAATEREDGHLPHPDPAGFTAWWNVHRARFAAGARYVAGHPVGAPAGCIAVLNEGTQRQRRAAAFELSRLRPGTPLFAVDAFALRQRRELGR
jgi:uncharacterized protein (TIGR02270 family)